MASPSPRQHIALLPATGDEVARMHATLEATNANLADIASSLTALAEVATAMQKFLKYALPWGVAVVSVAWPTIGKIMQNLPVLQ